MALGSRWYVNSSDTNSRKNSYLGYSFKSQGIVPRDTVELQTVDLATIRKIDFCMINLLLKFIALSNGCATEQDMLLFPTLQYIK